MAREPLRIRIDKARVREIYDDLAHIKNGAPRAMSRSINHTLGVTKTEAAQKIAGKGGLYALKVSYVKGRLNVRKASISKLQGAIQTPWRGMLLSRYPHSTYKHRSGVGVQVMKGKGNKERISDAFLIGPLKNSGAMAIARRTAPHRPGTKKRLQGIKILYGPSPSQAFKKVQPDLMAPSGNRLMQRLAYEADRLLAKQ